MLGIAVAGRPLLTPDEVRTLREDLQLVFLAGQRPIVAAKLTYYADREFAGRFDKARGRLNGMPVNAPSFRSTGHSAGPCTGLCG